jgi:hypothetical protein
MVQDLTNRLDDIRVGFDADDVRRTRSLLLTWKSWSCRVVGLLYGAEEAGRFDRALIDDIESPRSATAWVDLAKRCLKSLDGRVHGGFQYAAGMRSSRVVVNPRRLIA